MYLGNLKKNYFKRASQEKKEKNAKRHFLKDFFFLYLFWISLFVVARIKIENKKCKRINYESRKFTKN